MDIKVSLPKPNNTDGHDIKRFLRQMELSVHHLQKSWEEIEKDAEEHPDEWGEKWRDNFYIIFNFPKIDLYNRESDEKGFAKVHVDEETDQMQEIEVEIAQI
jgi:hypothetical protein